MRGHDNINNMKTPKLINHHKDNYCFFKNDSTVYRGTILLPALLLRPLKMLLVLNNNWHYQGHTKDGANTQLLDDIENIDEDNAITIGVYATREIVRILNLKRYKQQNYLIKII